MIVLGKIAFWVSIFGLFYIYVGYPLIVMVLARYRPRPVRKSPWRGTVSVVIAAYNEEMRIRDKLRNLLQLRGAENIIEIWVGSDGSTDRTAEVARACEDGRVQVRVFGEHRGKAVVINELVAACAGDVILFTDARQELEQNALVALLENMADPEVGVVSGELVFRDATDTTVAGQVVKTYWDYEKIVRRAESQMHSVPGATGAIYAMRRSLFRPIPPQTVLDDVLIPMQAVLMGYRCVFEPRAIAWDYPCATHLEEAARKRRTLAGNLQIVDWHPEWILPHINPIAWQFISHKVARLFSPWFLAFAWCGALAASALPFYFWVFVAQSGIAMVAGLALIGGGRFLTQRWFKLVGMFYAMNGTILLAWWDALRGRYRTAWKA